MLNPKLGVTLPRRALRAAVVKSCAVFISIFSTLASSQNVIISVSENYLMFSYPRAPFILNGRTFVSFPYTFLIIGPNGTKLVSDNEVFFFGHSIKLGHSVLIDNKPTEIQYIYDGHSRTYFVPATLIFNYIGLNYQYSPDKRIISLKGDKFFPQLLNSGAGTVFDNSSPSAVDAYPSSLSITSYNSIPNPSSNIVGGKSSFYTDSSFKFDFSVLFDVKKDYNIYLLYSYYNYSAGMSSKIVLSDSNYQIKYGLPFKCVVKASILNCTTSINKYFIFPYSNKLNPIKFIVLKIL